MARRRAGALRALAAASACACAALPPGVLAQLSPLTARVQACDDAGAAAECVPHCAAAAAPMHAGANSYACSTSARLARA